MQGKKAGVKKGGLSCLTAACELAYDEGMRYLMLLFCLGAAVFPGPVSAVAAVAAEFAPVAAVQRSVVKLLAVRGREVSEGSAFFALAPGEVVTNYHVVEGASHLYLFITAPDGKSVAVRRAILSRENPAGDLAVLRVEGEDLPPPIPVAARGAELLEEVVSIGYPGDIDEEAAKAVIVRRLTPGSIFTEPAVLAYLQPHFSPGHIAKIVPGRLYHTAAIDRGNSGGPLVNRAGEVVGINRSGTSDPFYPFWFAIPAETLQP